MRGRVNSEDREDGAKNGKKLIKLLKKFIPEDSAKTLADASHRRNSLLPIARLPEDLIIRIIQLASCTLSENPTGLSDSRLVLGFTRVCRQWRKITATAPHLWSFIRICESESAGSQFLLKAALERCSVSLLRVEICFPRRPLESLEYWPVLKSKSHLISSLLINVDAGTEMNALEIIKQPAPALQTLFVSIRPSPGNNLDYKAGIAVRSQLFHYQTPSLRAADLHHLAPPAASPLFAGLTRLCVKNASLYDQEFNTVDLLGILRRCPELEELELVNSGPRLQADGEERLRHVPRVRLRCLRKLHFAHQTPWVADPSNILHFIIAPSLNLVTLSQTGDLCLRRALLVGLKPQSHVDTIRFAYPMSSTGYEFELYNSTTGSLDRPVFAFSHEAELSPNEDIDPEFSDFIQSWGLATLERLDIASLAAPSSWDDYFSGFAYLRHLPSLKIVSFTGRQDVSGPEHTYVAEFLDNLEGLQYDEREEPVELMFDSVSFADPEHAGHRHVSKALAKLKGYLWRRMDRRMTLPRLILRNCPGIRTSFARKYLQPIVQHLEFEVWVGMDEMRTTNFLSPTSRLGDSKTSLAFTYTGSNLSTGSWQNKSAGT